MKNLIEQYNPVALFIMLYKVQGGEGGRGGGRGSSNLRVCGRNLKCSGPFIDRKLFGGNFLWWCLLYCARW